MGDPAFTMRPPIEKHGIRVSKYDGRVVLTHKIESYGISSRFFGTSMRSKQRISETSGGPVASVISVLVSVSLGLLYYHLTKSSDLLSKIDIAISCVVAINLYVATELFLRVFLLRSIKDLLEENKKIASEGLNYRNRYMKLSDKLIELSKKDNIIRLIGDNRVAEFTAHLHVSYEENRLQLDSQELTINAFIDFWRELIKLQQNRGKNHSITVFVTHVDGIDLYSVGSLGLELMAQQSDFVEAGGKIFRILIETNSTERDTDAYVKVLDRMSAAKIETSYLNTSQISEARELSYDILFVPDFKYSFEWIKHQGAIKGCIISRHPEDCARQQRTWNQIVQWLRSYNYVNDADIGGHIKILEENRKDFFRSYKSP